MMQLLVGLTVIFVVFVIYEVFKTVSRVDSTPSSAAVPEPEAEEAAVAPVVAEAAEPAETKVAQAERGVQLRNPDTGEVSPAPTNYRFAKKWVKEALVAEGLLDRVYKPTELNEAVTAKIKDALDKLKTLDKYRA
jgi:zona occludens toxin (predicted ATPase)